MQPDAVFQASGSMHGALRLCSVCGAGRKFAMPEPLQLLSSHQLAPAAVMHLCTSAAQRRQRRQRQQRRTHRWDKSASHDQPAPCGSLLDTHCEQPMQL